MASRARVAAFSAIQAMFLAWAIFGCLAVAQAEGLAAQDNGAALKEPTFVAPAGRRALSEPTRRENLGFCFPGCFGLLPTCCFGLCTNVLNNPFNCGSCGRICLFTTPICCNGVCTNLLTDPFNCGLCGRRCARGTCLLGFCNYNGQITL